MLDSVTLIRYNAGTVKNCESEPATQAVARLRFDSGLPIFAGMTKRRSSGEEGEADPVAAKTPQLKKRAKRDWTKAKAERFLQELADTCNVSEACRRSRLPMTVAYRRRKMDAAFRAEWAEMIGIGYSRLEGMLLKRAFSGVERVITRRDGSEERMREYSNQLGLQLLKMHRETARDADSEMPAEDADEIRERLVSKLQRLKKRNEEQETKRARLRGDAPRDGDAGGCK